MKIVTLLSSLAETINDVLDVVRDKCTLIDINYLEAVVRRFCIEETKTHIESYKKTIEEFCQKSTVCLCLEEIFSVTTTPTPLTGETATFVLNWDPDGYTLNDIRALLSAVFQQLAKRVTVKIIKEGNSIILTCTFPYDLLGSLIVKAYETVHLMNTKDLMKVAIGHCTIWNVHRRDKNVSNID